MSTSITYPSEFFTTTAANHLQHIRSQQFRPNRIAMDLCAAAERVDGGERVIIPFDVQEHSVTTQVVTGYEAADTNVQTIFEPGHDTWAFNFRPVIVSWVDDAKNTGRAQIIDLTKSRVENTEKALMQQFERRVLRQQAVAAMSDINTFNADDETGGFFISAANGSQTGTVHNFNRGTHSSHPGFQHEFYDMAGDASANALFALRHVSNRVRERTDDPLSLCGYMSLDFAENYLNVTQTQERYQEGGADAVAGTAVKAAGLTWKQTTNMPNAGSATGVANKEWSFLVIDKNCVKLKVLGNLKWQMTPFRPVGGGHEAQLAFFRFGGQTIITDWGSCGLGIGGDTY